MERPTDDAQILEVRERQKRNFLATLLCSQGVPMICGGDEISRTQMGNNNAYAQDNEITWLDWNLDDRKKELLAFTQRMIALRRSHPNLHRRKFFQDRRIDPAAVGPQTVDGETVQDITWFRPDGKMMSDEEWHAGWTRCLGMQLSGKTLNDVDRTGEPVTDDTFLFCLNSHHDAVDFYLPACSHGHYWRLVFDTRESTTECKDMACGAAHSMIARSAALFVEVVDPEGGGPALLSAAPAMREPEPESPAPPEQQPEQPPTPEPEPEMPARPEPQPEAPKPPEPEPEAPIKTRRRRPKKETAPV